MKKINYQPSIVFGTLMLLCAVSFSFTLKTAGTVFGTDSFEVYLNNKLVLKQVGKEMSTVKTLQLDQSASNGQLAIRYSHCGRVGTSRVVTIKDEQNVVLKEWKFGDTKDLTERLCCSVKDILALPKIKAGKKVNLYYSSTELPAGQLLAILTTVNKNGAAQP